MKEERGEIEKYVVGRISRLDLIREIDIKDINQIKIGIFGIMGINKSFDLFQIISNMNYAMFTLFFPFLLFLAQGVERAPLSILA